MVVRPLPKELQELAVQKLNEDPNRLQDDLKHIREWAKTLPHLKIRTDDQWLLNFLRGCRFKIDLVKRKLESLYTLKSRTPEWFTNRDPFSPEMQELLKLGLFLPLPNTTDPAAPRIILFRERTEALNFPIEDRAKLAFMVLDTLIWEDDNYVIAGCHLIADSKHISLQHVYQAQPGIVKKAYKIIAHGYATRPRGFHGINVPWVAKVAFNTFKLAASQKLLSMIHIYPDDNIDELYNTIPISLLPKEYGGNGGSIEELTIKWKTKIEGYRDWFLEKDESGGQEKCDKEDCDEEEEEYYEDAECYEETEYFKEEECYKDAICYTKEENYAETESSTKQIIYFEEFLGLGGLIG